jgi:hypothetical protein
MRTKRKMRAADTDVDATVAGRLTRAAAAPSVSTPMRR